MKNELPSRSEADFGQGCRSVRGILARLSPNIVHRHNASKQVLIRQNQRHIGIKTTHKPKAIDGALQLGGPKGAHGLLVFC